MNCFWAANDPKHPGKLLARSTWRNGVFRNYNTLNLFYVGYGGNDNTTTRFRRYYGQFYDVDEARIKPLIKEYTDPAHLLKPNQWYYIQIRVQDNCTTFLVDGEELSVCLSKPVQAMDILAYAFFKIMSASRISVSNT